MFTFNDNGNNITEHSNILISPFRANVIAFALFFVFSYKRLIRFSEYLNNKCFFLIQYRFSGYLSLNF